MYYIIFCPFIRFILKLKRQISFAYTNGLPSGMRIVLFVISIEIFHFNELLTNIVTQLLAIHIALLLSIWITWNDRIDITINVKKTWWLFISPRLLAIFITNFIFNVLIEKHVHYMITYVIAGAITSLIYVFIYGFDNKFTFGQKEKNT